MSGNGHVLRFWGQPTALGNATIRAACDCGGWATVIEGGHTTAELNDLASQHAGNPAGKP